MRTQDSIRILALAFLLFVGSARAEVARAPQASVESVGFSAEGMQKLDEALDAIVDDKKLSGVITLVARHGKVVHQQAYGLQDVAEAKPMQLDTIVRIYSMTKPVTGVALMMLYEEGKFKLEDPISKYIPEFKNLAVYSSADADGKPITQPVEHAPTMGELMSHTAGFTYGLFGRTPVDQLYQKERLFELGSLQQFVERVAALPLLYQPGKGWVYSVSADIQGYLVQKLSGKSFPEFMRERIFEPLGMVDTGFSVPQEKLGRLATIYSWNAQDGALAPQPRDPEVSSEPRLPSGGGGLYSTASDYMRFAQMLLDGGKGNGVRLLKRETVELMRKNRVPAEIQNGRFGLGAYRMQPGAGFGLDFAVLDDPTKVSSPVGVGTFSWYGIAGTWFWIDPTNDLIFVGMIQRRGGAPGAPDTQELSRRLLYQALANPKK